MLSLDCFSLQTMQKAPIPSKTVICLGNFDGVHLAHRALLRHAREVRDERFSDAACAVFCFAQSPADILSSNAPGTHLSSMEQKLECFREEGMEYALIADFRTLKDLTPDEFIGTVLRESCHCQAVICGFNYRFGKSGGGNTETLRVSFGNDRVFEVPEIQAGGQAVSSTRIRQLLWNGEVTEAAELLCRPYSFSAPVLHGKALGRVLGFPTVNQRFPKNSVIPCYGVYLTQCQLENGETFFGISNVGVHPTVDTDAPVNCETYLLEFDGDLYGKTVTVSFLKRIRSEIRFSCAEDLQKQVFADIETAKRLLKINK